MLSDRTTLHRLRLALLGILMLGMAGTLIELLFLAHDEDAIQLIPVTLTAVGLVTGGWNLMRPGRSSVRALQLVMVLFVAAGVAGIYYHYAANVEFQLEMEPELAGPALLWSVLQAKAPPAISPGLMVQLALIGFVYSWRHPALLEQKGDSV